MALWNRVRLDFDADDETINFGTRIITENNGSLYEACTVATIQSSEKVDQKPSILACLQYSKLCIAIDKSITIFENEMYDKILCNISFPSMIVNYCISKDGSFLFVVLATGILYCLHLPNGKRIFTKTIPDDQDNIIQIFLKEQNEEVFIILVMNTGVIYSFSKFYPKTLKIALTNDDKDVIAEHVTNIQCSQLFKGFTSEKFLNAAIDELSDELSITMVGINSIFIWPNEQHNNFSNVFSFGYKKIQLLYRSSKILCLRTDCTLSIICPNTLLELKIYDGPVFDFTVIQHNNVNHCEILLLTQSKQNTSMYVLRLISYPDFEQKLEINVSTTTYLLEVLFASNNILYIEGIAADNEVIDEFRLKTISESIPAMRLARLLRKKQFDAAEAFAKRSGLALESVYCSKAASFIEQFTFWTKSTHLISVEALINVLDKIQNIQYVIECCSKVHIPDYVQMRRIYLYAQQRIMQDIKKENINDSLNINLSLINDSLFRLETFQMIQYTEENTSLNYDTDIKEWIRFLQANLLEEYTTYLCMGHLKSATLIWTRHLPDIVKHVSMKTVQNIFAMLPEDTAPSYLWPWLTHFIPTLLSVLPDAIDEIISWGLKKLKHLEISYRTVWPEIGTDFAKKFIKLLKFEDGQQSIYFYQEYRYQNSLLKQFMFSLQALFDIQQLKDIYRLRVPLDIYIDSPIEAMHMLLDEIHLDKISDFVNTFLKQYVFNNNLQNDDVLCTYIQETIKNSNSWWVSEEAPWEKRITIIIEFIYNIEDRLKQTLTVLRKAPVPWSSTIITLAETSSNIDHELSFEIKLVQDYVPIKLVLKKYGYATIGINNKLTSRIIKEDRDSVINDIDTITKKDQQLRQDAFCRCISFQLNRGNLQKAMDIIYYLENDDITDALYCYEGIINYIIAASSFQDMATSLTCHMKILDCLEPKINDLLTKSNVCSLRCNNIIRMIKDLKLLYILKNNYKIDISLKDYHMQKRVILQNYITKLLSNMKECDLSIIHKIVVKIAELLGLEKSYATLCLLKGTKNVNTLLQLVSHDEDLNISDKFKYIYKMCLLALQDAAVNIDSVKVIKSLSASILNNCQDGDLESAVILHIYVSACPSLFIQHCSNVKQEIVPQSRWKLYTIYKDQAISLDERLLFLFNEALGLCLYCSTQDDNNEIRNCNEQMDQLLNSFLENVKTMQHQYHDYSLLQIFKMFYFMYCSISVRNKIIIEMQSILSQLLKNLLKKLCIERSFDLQLGLSCLFMLPELEACTWLSTICTFQTDHIRHRTISTLGYEYSRLGQNRSLIQMFENYKLLHIWAQRLSHYSITYKEILMNDASSKREILMQIVSNNQENVIPLLKDYCCSFGFNVNDCLLLYLQILLKTWNPTITSSNKSKELRISQNEVDELRKKCNKIVAELRDEFILKQCTSTLYEQINFYHYEVLIILMDLIGEKNMQKRNYLYFLQNYTRSGSPTQIEHDEWLQLNPGHSTLPSIAQWRLPFLSKIDIWKIITPELNLRTYDKWLDIAPILKLERHLICTLAIKGEVTRVWGPTKSENASWSLCSKNSTILKDIKKCIQQITGSDGFYYGTAALYYVINHVPLGADCVAAAKECYEYAQLAAQNSTKFEEGMLEKIKYKYLRFTSEHILRTYGLEKDKYLALIENPCKLIYELYNDESVPLRYRTATNYRPDINAAVNEIGQLFSLNTIKLRLDLLQKWLQSDDKYTDTELCQSFTETAFLKVKESDQNTDYEDNLFKICYILEYGDVDLFAQFLINIGFGDQCGQTQYNCNVQYRALWVLQNIIDTATLEELTKQDICTFRKHLKSLQYVSKLESLGLCYSVNSFETCSKCKLVQILLKSQRHSSYALSVMAQICIEFKIHDVLIWDNILSQMTKLRMVSELKKVLLQSQSENVIVNCNGYKVGWQLITSEPFREIDVNPNLQQIDSCIEAICLLYSCPVIHELNFTTIVKNCFQCKQASLAAALLPFLDESEKKFVLEMINQKCQITELLEELNHLSSKGILTIAHSVTILQKSVQG